MKRNIYIYQDALNQEITDLFSSLGSAFTVQKVTNNLLKIKDIDYDNEEPLDFEAFRELIIEDFNQDIVMIIEPYLEEDFILTNEIETFIKTLKKGVYYFEDLVSYVVVTNQEIVKQKLKKYLLDKVGSDVIDTVLAFIQNNMNSSSTSKKIFMHRNTLNYRIDNFIELTNLNVKTFKGANAVYMLYHF